ncbi:hypothetical protein RKD55_003343 [Rossellomorea marisflavi]
MYISMYLLWGCMIIQIILLLLVIKLVADFLNKFQTQIGIIEMIASSNENEDSEEKIHEKNPSSPY